MESFGYIGISIGIFPLWLLIYLKAKRLRLRMRNAGTYGGIIGMITEPLFVRDYWEPPVLVRVMDSFFIEDFIYTFLWTGVAIAIYNFVFRIKYVVEYKNRKKISAYNTLIILAAFFILNLVFGLNSLFVIMSGLFLGAVLMLVYRPDLIIPALVSGLLMMLLSIVIYTVVFNYVTPPTFWSSYWKLAGTPYEFYLFNVPWTEHLWHFLLGMHISIVYDFASGTSKTHKVDS